MPFARRRPVLRAAAVGGVAYMGARAGTNKAMKNVNAQQPATSQAAPPQPAPAPAPPAAAPDDADPVAQLQQLATLHESGALSDEEFAQAKARILG